MVKPAAKKAVVKKTVVSKKAAASKKPVAKKAIVTQARKAVKKVTVAPVKITTVTRKAPVEKPKVVTQRVSAEKEKPISKSEEKEVKMPVKKSDKEKAIKESGKPAAEKVEKAAKVDKAERPAKSEKAEKPEKSEKRSSKSGERGGAYHPEFTKSVLDQPEPPTGPIYRYSDSELHEFKDLILKKLEAAKKELVYLQGLITRKDEAGTDDTENKYMSMEDGSGSQEREQLNQMASRQIQFIDHLEKAIVRIENKTYGICRVTGKLIDKARLRAVPHATLSIEAKLAKSK